MNETLSSCPICGCKLDAEENCINACHLEENLDGLTDISFAEDFRETMEKSTFQWIGRRIQEISATSWNWISAHKDRIQVINYDTIMNECLEHFRLAKRTQLLMREISEKELIIDYEEE